MLGRKQTEMERQLGRIEGHNPLEALAVVLRNLPDESRFKAQRLDVVHETSDGVKVFEPCRKYSTSWINPREDFYVYQRQLVLERYGACCTDVERIGRESLFFRNNFIRLYRGEEERAIKDFLDLQRSSIEDLGIIPANLEIMNRAIEVLKRYEGK